MPDMTPELRQAIAQLIQTADAVEPAVTAEKQRSKLLKWTGAILQSNYFLSASVFGLVVINAVSLYFSLNPVREYFAVDNGRLVPIVALSAPHRTPSQVIQFVSSTLNEALALDFLNWRKDQERVRDRFSKNGFASYLKALEDSGILDSVRKKRMNLTNSTFTGVITWEGLNEGVYTWIVQVPVELRLVGQNTELPTQRFLATVRVSRTSTLDSTEGIALEQIVTAPMERN
ncbi:DotI/IcmL family type IV secretion protein [Achromobacter xylosoxidans]